jgi:predicted nucleotidyltransferase
MGETSKTPDSLITKFRNLLPTFQTQHHVRTLEVFGSYVRGDEKADSDLDILVTYDELPSLYKFIALENYLSDVLRGKVDFVMKDGLKPAIKKNILKETQAI